MIRRGLELLGMIYGRCKPIHGTTQWHHSWEPYMGSLTGHSLVKCSNCKMVTLG